MSSRLFEAHMKVSNRSTRLPPLADPVQINVIPLRDLKPSTRNARTHSKKQINQIAKSMVAFGWTSPILIDERGNIIAGVGRYLAAQQLGPKKVPVIAIRGLSDAEQRALALADNKIATNSGWDRAALATELRELATLLPECSLDLEITGFEPAEFDALVAGFDNSEQDPTDEIPTTEAIAVSRIEDIWTLGDHRLVCGDAANNIHAGALMGHERAAMVFADPPYNVQVASVVGRGKIKHREFASASGEMSRDEFTRFLESAFSVAAHYSHEGSIHYVCIDWRHLTEILAVGEEVFSELKNLVVWVKTNAGQGSFYRSQHELILVFKSGDGPHQNNIELGRHGCEALAGQAQSQRAKPESRSGGYLPTAVSPRMSPRSQSHIRQARRRPIAPAISGLRDRSQQPSPVQRAPSPQSGKPGTGGTPPESAVRKRKSRRQRRKWPRARSYCQTFRMMRPPSKPCGAFPLESNDRLAPPLR
jgi:hypothetical protein